MIRAAIRFEILSWWHAGTGRGAGPEFDATVVRTAAGLPHLPGRTVKGLVRDAVQRAEILGWVDAGRTRAWFGSALEGDPREREGALERLRFSTTQGTLWFANAVLGHGLAPDAASPAAWERWAETPEGSEAVQSLFGHFASTRLEEDGTALEGSLRSIEVVVPCTLRAEVLGPDDPRWLEDLEAALPLLRGVGSHRHRGLGRAQAALERIAP